MLDAAPPELAPERAAAAPVEAVLVFTCVATLAFGLAAEPLLALAERAIIPGG